jgi:hypothetical protein
MKLKPLLFVMPLLALLSCQRELDSNMKKGNVTLRFSNVVNGDSLRFGTPYLNRGGEDFTVTKYKYYISNIALIDTTGQAYKVPDSYFLLDHNNSPSLSFGVEVNEGRYQALRFVVGVDSIRNVSGAQTGALDPALDMFWTWSTGYIMAKFEGTSSLSAAPNNRIEYHIGGFQGPNNALRTVTLPFGQKQPVTSGRTLSIRIEAELLDWFDGLNDLSIAGQPAIMSPGAPASRFADNYSRMFTIISLQQQ